MKAGLLHDYDMLGSSLRLVLFAFRQISPQVDLSLRPTKTTTAQFDCVGIILLPLFSQNTRNQKTFFLCHNYSVVARIYRQIEWTKSIYNVTVPSSCSVVLLQPDYSAPSSGARSFWNTRGWFRDDSGRFRMIDFWDWDRHEIKNKQHWFLFIVKSTYSSLNTIRLAATSVPALVTAAMADLVFHVTMSKVGIKPP